MICGRRWYVAHTQPHREARAKVNLERQGFSVYFPVYRRTRRHARQTELVSRPLFPRYLFVELDLNHDRWRSIQSTFGVSHLVQAGDEPLAVPDGVIEEIRARQGNDGFVVMGLPAGVGPGSRVRLVDGIFSEANGILERMADERRVAVLLQLLGRQVRVFVPAASVASA